MRVRKLLQKIEKSLPARGAWIEILVVRLTRPLRESLPARGAWIEMTGYGTASISPSVAPRKGGVD